MKKNFVYKKIIIFILIFSFIAPTAFLGIPTNKTNAATGDFDDGANIVAAGSAAISAAADAVSAAADSSLVLKEFVLDGLVSLIKEILIKSITRSIVNWINGGFEGEPAFITDLEGFILDVGDQVLGSIIEKDGTLAFLCSPFKLDVRINVALDYYATSRDRVSCTLTGAIENIEDAFDDFSSGTAWDNWFQLSINPNNNAFGAFVSSRQESLELISNRQNEQKTILDWGRGIRSYEICDTEGVQDPNNSVNVSVGKLNCRIATPGVIINEQLNQVLGSGFEQLELADEINEIVGALLGQLVNQVLGGSSGGLSGLSSSRNDRPSYLDRLVQEKNTSSSVEARSLEAINNSLRSESEYRDAKQTSLSAVREAIRKVELLQQCYLEKASQRQTLWGVVDEEDTGDPDSSGGKKIISFTTIELINNAENATSTLTNILFPLQNRLEKDIENVDTLMGKLVTIRTKIESVQSVESLSNSIEEYQTLQQSNQLKTIIDVSDAKLERDGYPVEGLGLARGVVRDMETRNEQTNADLEVCRSLIFTYEPSTI